MLHHTQQANKEDKLGVPANLVEHRLQKSRSRSQKGKQRLRPEKAEESSATLTAKPGEKKKTVKTELF